MKTVKLLTMILLAVNFLTLPLLAKSVSYDDAKDIAVNWIYSTTDKKVSVDDSALYSGSSDSLSAFKNHFKYNIDSYEHRNSGSDTYWHGKIKADIDNRLPIYYGGYIPSGDRGDHAFLCDGYRYGSDDSKQYHFNWDWSGVADGWFNIDKLYNAPFFLDH